MGLAWAFMVVMGCDAGSTLPVDRRDVPPGIEDAPLPSVPETLSPPDVPSTDVHKPDTTPPPIDATFDLGPDRVDPDGDPDGFTPELPHPGPVCEGTDEDCGEEVCVDCTAENGWVVDQEAYFACDPDTEQRCVAEDRQYWEFVCQAGVCVGEITVEETQLSDCSPCEVINPCLSGHCDEGECHFDPTPGAPCGISGECDEYGVCSEGCEIEGVAFPDGAINPENECEVCLIVLDAFAWSPHDDVPCATESECTEGFCEGGVCVEFPFCEGTDEDCGCEECVDCLSQDGWFPTGESYPTCGAAADEICVARVEEYRSFACIETECVATVDDTRTVLVDDSCAICADGDDSNDCTVNVCEDGACVTAYALAGTPCGVEGECDGAGVCSEGCDIDGGFFAHGTVHPEDICWVCDTSRAQAAWSYNDGVACDTGDVCSAGVCDAGMCAATPYCAGSDTDCGCEEGACVDCTLQDGFYDVGEPYACCEGAYLCHCQDQEHRSFSCAGTECVASAGEFRTILVEGSCAICDDGDPCTEGVCDDGGCSFIVVPNAHCGVAGLCDDNGECQEGCEIDGVRYLDGTLNPVSECQICDARASQTRWSALPDDTPCGAQDECTLSYCVNGECYSEELPASTAPTGTTGEKTICKGVGTTLTATGGVHGGGASYEWGRFDECGQNPIAGATEESFNTGLLTYNHDQLERDFHFWVRRTGGCGGTTDCYFTTVTVQNRSNAPESIGGPSQVCLGTSTTLEAIGGRHGIGGSYEWGTGSCGEGIFAGESGASLETPVLTADTMFWVRRVGGCNTTPTDCATLTVSVNTVPGVPGVVEGMASICSGVAAAYTASEAAGATSHHWYYDGPGSVEWSGTTATLVATGDGILYVAGVNECGNGDWSVMDITILPDSTAPTGTTGETLLCYGDSTTLTASGGVHGAWASYQWGMSVQCGNNPGEGETEESYTTPLFGWAGDDLERDYTIWVRRTGGCGGTTDCAFTTVTVHNTSTAPESIGGPSQVCLGTSTTLEAIGGRHGIGGSYEWGIGSCGEGIFAGESGASLETSVLAADTTFWVRRVGGCNTTPTDCATRTVSVKTAPAQPGAIEGSASICYGEQTLYHVDGVAGATDYEWVFDGEGDVSPVGNMSLLTATGSGNLRVRAANECGNSSWEALAITVHPTSTAPTGTTGEKTICYGTSTTLTATGGVHGGGASYEWGSLLFGGCGENPIEGATEESYQTPNLSYGADVLALDYEYWVRRTGGCGGSTSCYITTVTVQNRSSAPESIVGPSQVCLGTSTTLEAIGGRHGIGGSYEWGIGSCGQNIIAGESGASLETSVLASNTTFWVRRVGGCNTTPTDCATRTVTMKTAPARPGAIQGSASICYGEQTFYRVDGVAGATDYEWVYDGEGDISPVGNTSLLTATGSGTLWVRAANECGNSSWQSLSISVQGQPGWVDGSDDVICLGELLGVTLRDHNGDVQRWEHREEGVHDWEQLSWWTSTSLNVLPESATVCGYRAVVKSGGCPEIISEPFFVDVRETLGGTVTGGKDCVRVNESPGRLNLSGHSGSILSWQVSIDGAAFSDMSGTAGRTRLDLPEMPATGVYVFRVRVRNSPCGEDNSSERTIIVVDKACP